MSCRAWMAAWILGIASSAMASVFSPGDVIIGGQPVCVITCPPCGNASFIEAFSQAASFRHEIPDQVGCGAPNDALMLGNDILVANGNRIHVLQSDGTLVPFASGFPELITSLAINEYGTIFAGQYLHPIINKFDSTGRVLGSFTVPTAQFGILTMDLAPDQCTLFYSSGSVIKRFDVCRSVALSDFVDLGAGVSKIRLLPDGGVIASTTAAVVRVSPVGAIISQFAPGRISIAVPTADSVWVGSGGQLARISLINGATVAGPVSTGDPSDPQIPPGGIPVDFILVVGEQRAAQAAAAIPALSWPATIAMILLLATITVAQLNRR